jgi:hypothetical protein
MGMRSCEVRYDMSARVGEQRLCSKNFNVDDEMVGGGGGGGSGAGVVRAVLYADGEMSRMCWPCRCRRCSLSGCDMWRMFIIRREVARPIIPRVRRECAAMARSLVRGAAGELADDPAAVLVLDGLAGCVPSCAGPLGPGYLTVAGMNLYSANGFGYGTCWIPTSCDGRLPVAVG